MMIVVAVIVVVVEVALVKVAREGETQLMYNLHAYRIYIGYKIVLLGLVLLLLLGLCSIGRHLLRLGDGHKLSIFSSCVVRWM
jgi:hypothetical protein